MEQTPLFHEDLNAALVHLVSALGGPKKVAASMWPAIKCPEKAGRRLSDCLRDNHQQKLDLEDLLWLLEAGRKAGIHSAMAFITDQAGYDRPKPLEPEDERAKLQREYTEATKMMAQIADRMERLNAAGAQP